MAEKKRYSIFTIITAILWACIPLYIVLGFFLPKPKYFFLWYRPIIMYISILPLICSIISVFHVIRNKRLKGLYISLGLFILSLLSQLFLPKNYFPPYLRPHPDRFSCATSMKGLGTSFLVCENKVFDENNDFLIPDDWCDYLICHADVGLGLFYCRDSGFKDGESGYALNENIIGKVLGEIPANVVLLFESDLGKDSKKIQIQERDFYNKLMEEEKLYFNFRHKVFKDQWNQIGGPDDISMDRHLQKGCNVLYSDGHVEFINAEDIPSLRWTVEEAPLDEVSTRDMNSTLSYEEWYETFDKTTYRAIEKIYWEEPSGDFTHPDKIKKAKEMGENDATRDINNEVLIILRAGYPSPILKYYRSVLREKGIRLYSVAGCATTPPLNAYVEAYNEVSKQAIKIKYGSEVFEKSYQKADDLYRKQKEAKDVL